MTTREKAVEVGRTFVRAARFFVVHALLEAPLRLLGLLHIGDGIAAWLLPVTFRLLVVLAPALASAGTWADWRTWSTRVQCAVALSLYLLAFLSGMWSELRRRDVDLAAARGALAVYQADRFSDAIRYLRGMDVQTDSFAMTGLEFFHAIAWVLVDGVRPEGLAAFLNSRDLVPDNEMTTLLAQEILSQMALFEITRAERRDGVLFFTLGPRATEIIARTRNQPLGRIDEHGIDVPVGIPPA